MKQTSAGPFPIFRDVEPQPPVCRTCGKVLDACTGLQRSAKPDAGSLSICGYCGELSIFDDDRLLREPTPAELADLQRSEQWPSIERLMRAFGGERR